MTCEIDLSEKDQLLGREFVLRSKEPKKRGFGTQAMETILERWFVIRANRANQQGAAVE
jgi:hypothetical protein